MEEEKDVKSKTIIKNTYRISLIDGDTPGGCLLMALLGIAAVVIAIRGHL